MPSASILRFLTTSQVKRLHARHIAKTEPTQPALLDSAVNSPINHSHYGQTDSHQLAGLLAQRVALNHAFQDGNKRTALHAVDIFQGINGARIEKPPHISDDEFNEDLTNAHVGVATKELKAEDLGAYYAALTSHAQALKAEE